MVKKETFEIMYWNEHKVLITTSGQDFRVGTVEYSWYDLKLNKRIFINKDSFFRREEINGR